MNQVELNCRIKQLSELYDCACAVYDSQGKLIQTEAKTEMEWPESESIREFIRSQETAVEIGSFLALKPEDVIDSSLIILLPKAEAPTGRELKMLELWLHDVLLVEENLKEKVAFLKNVLLENELPGDIPLKARQLKIDFFRPRKAILLRMLGADDPEVHKILRNFFPTHYENYFIPMDESNHVILFDAENLGNGYEQGSTGNEKYEKSFNQVLNSLINYLEDYSEEPVHLGVGMLCQEIKDIARTYREASLALTVGAIFASDQNLMRYDQLGLGRLIYQLPPTLCELFLTEVFQPYTYEQLDQETLNTIEKFFENNLNGSETSRKLFVHRNTLVYRLDKVEKITGLDLRNFDDAVLFKLAEMVRKYLEALKSESNLGSTRVTPTKRRVRKELD